MVLKREAGCPLCGARMQPAELLDACGEVIDASLGVLSAHCPHCQGYLEARPQPDRLDIGYLVGAASKRFDVAIPLPADGLVVLSEANGGVMTVALADRRWQFAE